MKRGSFHFRFLSFAILAILPVALGYTPARAGNAPVPQDMPMQGKAHQDHKPKHGGSFFMSVDNQHHLEGVLVPPGVFRVYLYDDHTKPLKADQMKLASGAIQVGDAMDAPKMPLVQGKRTETMEVALGPDVKFPIDIALLMHLPGMAPDAKPELFNFTFKEFTKANGPGTTAPMGSMRGM